MKSFFIMLCVFAYLTLSAQYKYPVSKIGDNSDTYFGVTYKDPYRWLEDMKDSSVVRWFKSQANLSNSTMSKVSGRDELIAEWTKLNSARPTRIFFVSSEAGRIFYKKSMPGETIARLYYRPTLNEPEKLIFDPTTFIKGKTLTLQTYTPSHDGKKVAVFYAEGGGEISTIRILDVDNGIVLPEQIYPTADYGVSWTEDSNSFMYLSFTSGDPFDPQYQLNTKGKLHVLGTDSKMDRDIFSNATSPELKMVPEDLALVTLKSNSKAYIFAEPRVDRLELFMYFAPISQLNSEKINWKVLCRPEDQIVRGHLVLGNDVYAISSKNVRNFQLLHTTLPNPDWSKADIVIAEKRDKTLENIINCKDYLLITYSDGINNQLVKYNLKTKKISEIKLPFSGTAFTYCFDDTSNSVILTMTSWNKPVTSMMLNLETDEISPSLFNKPVVYPETYTKLLVKEVEVKGHDGAMIPLSIIYKEGTKLDGSNVCFMESYGAYGYSMTPYFDMMTSTLAVKGVILAFPHVRGGSEKGDDWYKGGLKTTKPNTWKDFNSCAEYLIRNGYTAKGKIAGSGTSAGGVLISRAITERPDLYGAAICNVGCANAMRMEITPNGPTNIPEFGTVKDSIESKALYEMDGVAHVVSGVKYPAVMCVAGWNDPRVIAWEPGKFAAALQNASTSGKPVLMKVNYDNGHFTEDQSVTYANFADQFSFVLWQCGHKDFQMKK